MNAIVEELGKTGQEGIFMVVHLQWSATRAPEDRACQPETLGVTVSGHAPAVKPAKVYWDERFVLYVGQ
jgi:hypothetical protein